LSPRRDALFTEESLASGARKLKLAPGGVSSA
jgi:hypothetical protein